MRILIHKPRGSDVDLRFISDDKEAAVVLTMAEFHGLIELLSGYDDKSWNKQSLILLNQDLSEAK